MEKENSQIETGDNSPAPTAEGIKHFSNDDSVCYVWALFNKKDCQLFLRELEDALASEEDTQHHFDLAHQLTGWYSQYNGPGRNFANDPVVRVSRNRILVTQRRGLDI